MNRIAVSFCPATTTACSCRLGIVPAGAKHRTALSAAPAAAHNTGIRRPGARFMSKEDQLRRVLDCGIVAVVRSQDSGQLVEVCRALVDGGVSVVEITMTVPNALEVVSQVRRALGDRVLLGAGTILDAETARAALLAGAEYLVAPTLNLDVIRLCRRYDKMVMPGCFTPTEVLTAWEAGADIVKVFPADVVGPAFFKALRGPLPQIRLMPTGGVDLSTAADFLRAGACCLGVGTQLVEPKTVAEGNFDRIRDLARQYRAIVQETRRK
jgi:2-dehydro-3-deoxyphosphogluconate aldolase/(4S)-4-hydroxy-2-oxoglutarate aldolase